MISLDTINNLLNLILEFVLVVVSLLCLLKFKKAWQKIISVAVLLITVSALGLNFYLKPSDDSISANLKISVYKPLVINVNGTYKDDYLLDGNYRTLCSETYPLDTKFDIIITNLKTFKRYKFKLSDVYEGKSIGNFESGKYKVELYIKDTLIQTDQIILNSENVNDNYTWDYSIYVINDFYEKAIKKEVSIGENIKDIQIPAFSIHSDNTYIYQIFDTNYSDNRGTFEGDFYFIPDRYFLNNAVSNSMMSEIIIDLSE